MAPRFRVTATTSDINVAIETLRTLKPYTANPAIHDVLSQKSIRLASRDPHAELHIAISETLASEDSEERRPPTVEAWQSLLAEGGDADRGRRVFFTKRLMCSTCHSIDGGVRMLGPNLGGIGHSVNRRQIINSILRPSEHFPPQYQARIVHTKDGGAHGLATRSQVRRRNRTFHHRSKDDAIPS